MLKFSSLVGTALAVWLITSCSDHDGPSGDTRDSGTSGAGKPSEVQDASTSTGGSLPGTGGTAATPDASTNPADSSTEPPGSQDASTDGSNPPPDRPTDVTAPEFRSALINTIGAFAQRFDLGVGDVTAILPRATTAEVTIFAKDETTAYEDLHASVADELGTELPALKSEYANGIWKVTVAVQPGMTLVPRATDAAGNTAVPLGKLVFSTRDEAVLGAWHIRTFNPSTLQLASRLNSTWTNGHYKETAAQCAPTCVPTGVTTSGSFYFDGDPLTIAVTDGDSGTPSTERTAKSFIDDSAFSDAPFERTTSSESLPGTWTRSWMLKNNETNTLENLTETLVFDVTSGFTRTRTGTRTVANTTPTNVNETSKGTYRATSTGSYTAGNVYFVGFTTTERNGGAVSGEAEEFDEYVLRSTVLMLNPRRR